jgi:predicted molibdopterin-dependent oxidoreductase YjgC
MRVTEHPILGKMAKGREVEFEFDGKPMRGYEREPIATALMGAGVKVFRYTAKDHNPRGVFCAIGRCTDCVMTVDGMPNVRTCVTPLRKGMRVQTQTGLGAWEEGR